MRGKRWIASLQKMVQGSFTPGGVGRCPIANAPAPAPALHSRGERGEEGTYRVRATFGDVPSLTCTNFQLFYATLYGTAVLSILPSCSTEHHPARLFFISPDGGRGASTEHHKRDLDPANTAPRACIRSQELKNPASVRSVSGEAESCLCAKDTEKREEKSKKGPNNLAGSQANARSARPMPPLCRLSFRDGLPQGNVKIELLASSADSAMCPWQFSSPARKSRLSDCLDMTHKIDKMASHAGARPTRIQFHNRQSQSASSIMHRPSSTQDIVSSHLLAVNVAFPFTEYQDQHPLERIRKL